MQDRNNIFMAQIWPKFIYNCYFLANPEQYNPSMIVFKALTGTCSSYRAKSFISWDITTEGFSMRENRTEWKYQGLILILGSYRPRIQSCFSHMFCVINLGRS